MPMLFPQSSIWRCGAKPRKRTRSLKFLQQREQRRGKWLEPCVQELTLCNICKIIFKSRANSRGLPSCASRLRLLSLRRRSFRTPDCRYGVDLDDLGATEDYENMLATKWRLGTDEDALVLRLNVQAIFLEQKLAEAGPLTGYIAMRSLPDGSISCLLRKRATANPFTRASCYPWSSKGEHEYYNFTKKSGAYHTSFNHQRSTKSPSQTQKCVWIKRVTRWRELESTYTASRAFPRETPERGRFFFERRFNHFPLQDFSETNGNR